MVAAPPTRQIAKEIPYAAGTALKRKTNKQKARQETKLYVTFYKICKNDSHLFANSQNYYKNVKKNPETEKPPQYLHFFCISSRRNTTLLLII